MDDIFTEVVVLDEDTFCIEHCATSLMLDRLEVEALILQLEAALEVEDNDSVSDTIPSPPPVGVSN